MRDRLSKLINQSDVLCDTCGECTSSYCAEAIADYLIKSGVIVPPCKVGDMTRYIDADKLIAHLKDEIEGCKPHFGGGANGKSIAYGTVLGLKAAISFAETLSAADVVPKSEVEHLKREVRLLTENSITAKYPHCVVGSYYAVLTKSLEDYEKVIADISSAAKAEVAREIFEEIERMCIDTFGNFNHRVFAELKKKYTEVSK